MPQPAFESSAAWHRKGKIVRQMLLYLLALFSLTNNTLNFKKNFGGAVRPACRSRRFTLFKTNICDFSALFMTWPLNLWSFQTCLRSLFQSKCLSFLDLLPQLSAIVCLQCKWLEWMHDRILDLKKMLWKVLWMALIAGLIDNDEKLASSKKHWTYLTQF